MPVSADEQALWDEATDQLGFHARPGQDWLDTLNRLWRKNRFVMSMDGVLKLDVAAARADAGHADGQRRALAARAARAARTPGRARPGAAEDATIGPILLLEWQGRHFLIDGINRINRRIRGREPGPHEVIVIHVRI